MKLVTQERVEKILQTRQILLDGMPVKAIIKALKEQMLGRYILLIMKDMVDLRKKLIEKNNGLLKLPIEYRTDLRSIKNSIGDVQKNLRKKGFSFFRTKPPLKLSLVKMPLLYMTLLQE